MRLLRFMSAAEAIKLLDGETIVNNTKHADVRASSSVGACFALTNETESDDEAIYLASRYLSGIVDMHTCFIGEPKSSKKFEASTGRYRQGEIVEACTTAYSLTDFNWWSLYTPETSPTDIMRMISSFNWINTKLLRTNKP